ncbi:MAG: type II toxin-antitoxin system RelE/ParE family toxin [Pyrinomonadaceae bacterium]
MNVVITESASDDIAEGYLFYEEQYQGLGDYFEASILADIRSLVIYAGVHEIHFGIYYRKIASRFPPAIYYTVETDAIMVYAVADTRRDPAWFNSRLNDKNL